jgi:hypothetical protein
LLVYTGILLSSAVIATALVMMVIHNLKINGVL